MVAEGPGKREKGLSVVVSNANVLFGLLLGIPQFRVYEKQICSGTITLRYLRPNIFFLNYSIPARIVYGSSVSVITRTLPVRNKSLPLHIVRRTYPYLLYQYFPGKSFIYNRVVPFFVFKKSSTIRRSNVPPADR